MGSPAALACDLMRRLWDIVRFDEWLVQLSKNHTIDRTSYCCQILHSREEKSALLVSVNGHIMKHSAVPDARFSKRSNPTPDLVDLSKNRANNFRSAARRNTLHLSLGKNQTREEASHREERHCGLIECGLRTQSSDSAPETWIATRA
jgi:hypothetical protein